ncbi:flagellar protein [uncultured Anaeromusa sp.]|uniref:flagellar protein n=1 Tax=uncultured Anaeromusa sp. TaxID=673273 RepID=UPI0029C91966|nr:flagellar protein [uncultured Anaeromusa sp.]
MENPQKLCRDCLDRVDEEEKKIAEYLRKVNRAGVHQIQQATGVREKTINRMLKQGRLFGDFTVEYSCEMCGTTITEGRVCAPCLRSLEGESAVQGKSLEESIREKRRMYTSDRKN